jgi:hypothetical protein
VEVDWGLPVELPIQILLDLAEHAATTITGVVLRNGLVVRR